MNTSINKIIHHAEQHCKTHGARLTDKRKIVLSGLLQAEKAMSAYELIELCKSEYDKTLPAMSMYRILEFLQNEHLVHKLSLANKYVACANITCDHEHRATQFLICGQCQKVEELSISQSAITQLQKSIKGAGFHLANPQLEINCICNNCMSGRDEKASKTPEFKR